MNDLSRPCGQELFIEFHREENQIQVNFLESREKRDRKSLVIYVEAGNSRALTGA